jgi:hypothetical protein
MRTFEIDGRQAIFSFFAWGLAGAVDGNVSLCPIAEVRSHSKQLTYKLALSQLFFVT